MGISIHILFCLRGREAKISQHFDISQGLSGQQWYQLEASRAVNQAIGRIIRHRNDYGAIILCDCRFNTANFKKQLSAWLRPYVKSFPNFGVVTKDLREFFRYADEAVRIAYLQSWAKYFKYQVLEIHSFKNYFKCQVLQIIFSTASIQVIF